MREDAVVIHSAAQRGAEAVPVTVIAELVEGPAPGRRGILIEGLRETDAREAESVVRCALQSSWCESRTPVRVTVSGDGPLRPRARGLGLSIAAACLAVTGQIPSSWLEDALLYGDLDLDGAVRPVGTGTAAAQALAARGGLRLVTSTAARDRVLPGDRKPALGVPCLADLKGAPGSLRVVAPSDVPRPPAADFADIAGHPLAKRALSVAAVGRHGICLIGGEGGLAGEMARRLPGILPDPMGRAGTPDPPEPPQSRGWRPDDRGPAPPGRRLADGARPGRAPRRAARNLAR